MGIGKSKMADIRGVKVTDLTGSGSSDDGGHVWITHRLGDGSEYPLVYPYEAIGYLITVLTDAARSASRRRVARNPQEAAEGLNSNVIPVEEVRVGTSPENSGDLASDNCRQYSDRRGVAGCPVGRGRRPIAARAGEPTQCGGWRKAPPLTAAAITQQS